MIFSSKTQKLLLLLHCYQMLEEQLKILVGVSHEILQSVAPPPVRFKVHAKKIEDASLGKIVSMYQDVSTSILIEQLNAIVPDRNKIAHKAFAYEFLSRNPNEMYSEVISEQRVDDLLVRIPLLIDKLGEESIALREMQKKQIDERSS